MIHGEYVEVGPVIKKYLEKHCYYFYFCGGRGIGKTYSGLDTLREIATGDFVIDKTQAENKFMYMRRTGVEAQSVASPEGNVFKKYNKQEGYDIYPDFSDKLGFGNFYFDHEENRHIGYLAALSTFANLRGVDFSDVNLILYDECVPESKNKAPLKNEGFLLLNVMETINRNRFLEGKSEVVLVLLSNPIDLGNPLLSQLDITKVLNTMVFKNQQRYTDYNRCLHIEKYKDHVISQKKAKSALYRFARTTGFNEEALSGDFVNNDLDLIAQKINLKEYTAHITLENVCIYFHKSTGGWYISQTVSPSKYYFRACEREKVKEMCYWKYKLLMIERMVKFDNFSTKVVFENMINYKPYQ